MADLTPTAEPGPPLLPAVSGMPPGVPAPADDAGSALPPPRPRERAATAPARRPTVGFLWRHPAHGLALGLGSGLSPKAPGTVGTLWAWVSFLVLDRVLDDAGWALCLLVGFAVGWWSCTRTAQHLGVADPGAIVWDEVLAFWLVLWILSPAGFWMQLAAFGLFRWFDAVKPGPVGWADRRFKQRPGEPIGWRQGFGILFDDLVAAGCTLLVLALWVQAWHW